MRACAARREYHDWCCAASRINAYATFGSLPAAMASTKAAPLEWHERMVSVRPCRKVRTEQDS